MQLLPVLAQTAEEVELKWSADFFGLTQDQRFVVLIVAIGCATVVIITVVSIVAAVTHSHHKQRTETELKQEMLDRGMNAEEISQVIESTPPTDFLERWVNTRKKKSVG